MSQFRPMLAVDAGDLAELRYPLLASWKIDGIRCVITKDGPRTRSLKPVPNIHVAKTLMSLREGLDGELVVFDKLGKPDFRTTTSAIMSHGGEPEFKFCVFDDFTREYGFAARARALNLIALPPFVDIVAQRVAHNPAQVKDLFEEALFMGYEGLILRDPNGAYKQNRSTLREQGMLKVKPWEDAEALVIDCLPEYANHNEQTRDERGFAKRSTAKAGREAREMLGRLVVRNLARWPKDFEIGTGFTDTEKAALWKDKPIGKVAKFAFVNVGGYDVPRHCSFRGFRAPEDLEDILQ
jgi:DNA ligase-1